MASQNACATVRKDPLSPRERDRERAPKKLLRRARALRRQSSDTEKALWEHLRARRLNGYKFRRQVVIESYIVDFICVEAKLIIEADGGQHTEQKAYDAVRTTRTDFRCIDGVSLTPTLSLRERELRKRPRFC